MNMEKWLSEQIANKDKGALPLLSYPSIQLMFITVDELCYDANCQAIGMRLLADRYNMPIAGGYMDLSVEAEAFGANCVHKRDEIPTITGQLIETQEEADALKIPEVGDGRTGIAVEGIQKAKILIPERPVFANCCGPFSLAGRLMDVNEILLETLVDPDLVHTVVGKATEFIIKYIKAFKEAGADGLIMAEPLAGLLSPDLMQEFSTDYVKKIVAEVQDEEFIIMYHNCAGGMEKKIEQTIDTGCRMFHYGDGANMVEILKKMPKDVMILGNISPSSVFKADSSKQMAVSTQNLLVQCMTCDNFLISSGCDIPADTSIENIDTFFEVVEKGYYKAKLWNMLTDKPRVWNLENLQ